MRTKFAFEDVNLFLMTMMVVMTTYSDILISIPTHPRRTFAAVIARVVGHYAVQSHAGTVVPECFKDDNVSQWKSGKFDPRSLKNPRTDRHLNLHG